jgi:hypothetical protein
MHMKLKKTITLIIVVIELISNQLDFNLTVLMIIIIQKKKKIQQ